MTQSSLPKVILLLENNPSKRFTYQEIADSLEINVTNVNKLVSELVSENKIIKYNTRPVIIKLKLNEQRQDPCCSVITSESSSTSECCQVEALVTVDRKGQILLPKDLRDKQNIKVGDKFALINVRGKDDSCCLILMKSDVFEPILKDALSPVLKIVIKNDE